jgi:(p)ppGpp synthase/HD superfamily hydrolase
MGECRENPPQVTHPSDVRHDNSASCEGLLRVVREHHPYVDLAPIELAQDEAAHWHAGQSRRSGDPYLPHCVAVAA